jgi:predicted transcriptional regulator
MKSASSSWSFLRDSVQLRAAIKYRMEELDLSINDVALHLEIAPDRVSKYLRSVKPSLTNWQIIKLANHLKLEAELNIRFLPTL